MEDLLGRLAYVAGDTRHAERFDRSAPADEPRPAKAIVHYLALPPTMFAETVEASGGRGAHELARAS